MPEGKNVHMTADDLAPWQIRENARNGFVDGIMEAAVNFLPKDFSDGLVLEPIECNPQTYYLAKKVGAEFARIIVACARHCGMRG